MKKLEELEKRKKEELQERITSNEHKR